jgi:hypothetical protein
VGRKKSETAEANGKIVLNSKAQELLRNMRRKQAQQFHETAMTLAVGAGVPDGYMLEADLSGFVPSPKPPKGDTDDK